MRAFSPARRPLRLRRAARRCARRWWRRALVASAVLGALAVAPVTSRAQTSPAAELAVLGINALLGGATAGVAAHINDGSFLDALGVGALGGSAVYAGKRLATADLPGAGLAGRIVAAAGASVVRNAAAPRPAFARLVLPVGPVSVYLSFQEDSRRVRPKLHLGRTVYLAHRVVDGDYGLDWSQSLSAGTPVFRGRGMRAAGPGGDQLGTELLGTISLSDTALVRINETVLLTHERVHVVQGEFVSLSWGDPVEDWVLERVPGGDWVGRYVDTDVPYLGLAWLGVVLLPYDRRPWEIEADYLGGG